MEYNNTYEWLVHELEHILDSQERLERCGMTWTPIASVRKCGSILALYKSCESHGFCAHAGDDWHIFQEPFFGYFSKDLSYNELLIELSNRYDSIRKQRMK